MEPMSYRKLAKPVSTRVRCPVCHEEVYSRAGIHPQCAARQCDPPRQKGKAVVAMSTVQSERATGGTLPVLVEEPNLGIASASVLPPC